SIRKERPGAPGGVGPGVRDVYGPAEKERQAEIERALVGRAGRALRRASLVFRATARADVIENGSRWRGVEQGVCIPDGEGHRGLSAVLARVDRLQIVQLGAGTEP